MNIDRTSLKWTYRPDYRSALEWYQWIGLSKKMSRYRLLIFNYDLEFVKGVRNSIALHAQIYLITNGLGGQQVSLFPEL